MVHYPPVSRPKPRQERRAFWNWRFQFSERRRHNKRWAVALVLSIPLFLFSEQFILNAGRVTDVSMVPTLVPGSYYLINKYVYHFRLPRRGEIVVIRPPGKERWRYIKRVVALPQETLSVVSGRVHINGRPLEEPYASGSTHPDLGPRVVPEGSYFLLGDNRAESEDSRHFGYVPFERVEGKVRADRWFSLW